MSEEPLTADEKFNTCANRTIKEVEIGEIWCCGDNLRSGHICWRLNIEDVKPKHCKDCKHYEKR